MNRFLNKIKLYIFSILFLFSVNTQAQNKLEISSGFGFMELLNLGIYYNLSNNFQTGFKIGTIPIEGNERVLTFTGCFDFFYTGNSKFTSQKTWYLNSGINYFIDESERTKTEIVFLNIRHGKVFNFSKRLGLKVEAGIGIGLYYHETNKSVDYMTISDEDENSMPLMPNIGIDLFYRF